jgi:hypothetical protein
MFLFTKTPKLGLGAHPISSIQRVSEFFAVAKPARHVADSSHPIPTIRMTGAIPALPLYVFVSFKVTLPLQLFSKCY